jgi:flagellar basal-body rod protein FlgC
MSKGLFSSIKVSATGLRGQRVKMDVVARNLANAETSRTEEGTPYRRQRAVFREVLADRVQSVRARLAPNPAQDDGLTRTHDAHLPGLQPRDDVARQGLATEVATAPDASEFRVVYDPGHPDADEEGYVLMPNVDMITEMVDMIAASRAYEANLSSVQASKDMFMNALKI